MARSNRRQGEQHDDHAGRGHGRGQGHHGDPGPSISITPTGTIITGTAGRDRLVGGEDRDTISGGDGNDRLFGRGGNDTLIGGQGNDRLFGGDGIDMASYRTSTQGVTVDLRISERQDTGGAGIDRLVDIENVTGGTGNDLLIGDAGNNFLAGYLGDDTLHGGDGNDVLMGGAGNDRMDGGDGFDTVSYDGTAAGVTVSLAATEAQDTGGSGQDSLVSIEKLVGGSGDDWLGGSSGGDVLVGGAGDDWLTGADGNDTLVGGLGDDIIDGGAGADTASYFSSTGDVTVDLRLGADPQDTGDAGIDQLHGIENLIGGQGDDRLHGDASTNVIAGSAGDDTIRGYEGTDYLNGGAGDDVLVGGDGRDRLAGGAGADRFVLEDLDDSGPDSQRDVIADFAQSDGDRIDLSMIDADPTTDGDQAFEFIGYGLVFNGTPGQLSYWQNDGRTLIEGDINGDTVADFHVELAGSHLLNADDFLL